jgi:hypothetical protein
MPVPFQFKRIYTLKKLNFIIVILIVSTLSVFSQKPKVKNDPSHDDKPIHFGFSLGFNFMDYRIEQSEWAKANNYYVGLNEIKPGINIQAISNLRISEYFDLRCLPGISFGERQLYFIDDTNSNFEHSPHQIESSFLELPLYIKYKADRKNNFRPYLLGGVNMRYDLAIKDEYDFKEQLIMFKHFDIYSEFGGGFDFYLPHFKFAIELKFSMGMTDIFRSTNPAGSSPDESISTYTNMIDQIKSSIFIISFHFE